MIKAPDPEGQQHPPPPEGVGWMPVTDEDVANWPEPVVLPGPEAPFYPPASPQPAATPEPASAPEPAAWDAWDANTSRLLTPTSPPAAVEGEAEDENGGDGDDGDDDMNGDDNGRAVAASPSRGE